MSVCGHPSRRGEVAAPQDEGFDAERECSLPTAMTSSQTTVAIIGAGPAGLMAAEVLARGGADVTVYDAMPSAGRKFLMAGGGGGFSSTSAGRLGIFVALRGASAPPPARDQHIH